VQSVFKAPTTNTTAFHKFYLLTIFSNERTSSTARIHMRSESMKLKISADVSRRVVRLRGTAMRLLCGFIFSLVIHDGHADGIKRTQSVELQPGWNAVYLEIDPDISTPSELFADVPVDVVASFVASGNPAQFIKNPTAKMLSVYGWAVWYAPSRSDDFLSNLFAIQGAKSYLIHAKTNATLHIEGTSATEAIKWTPNSYNYVGFSVVSPGAPTFQNFFRGSSAHNHNKIYRLVDGTWRQVLNPGAEVMKAGEAFWIYCDGRSDYPGPLEVSTRMSLGVNLSSQGGDQVIFRNRTIHPVSFTVEHITDPNFPVPISTPVVASDDEAGGLRTVSVHFDAAHFEQDFPALEAGDAMRLPLMLRLQDAGEGERYSLLKVTTDLGTTTYIPVTATRGDL